MAARGARAAGRAGAAHRRVDRWRRRDRSGVASPRGGIAGGRSRNAAGARVAIFGSTIAGPATDPGRIRAFAAELVATAPEVIFAHSTPATIGLLQATRSIPIVFASVSDPVGDGIVASFARPGGNVTGFTNVEASMGGKWLEILKELAPAVTRVGFLFNPATAPGGGSYFLRPFEAAAPSFNVQPIATPVEDVADVELALASLAAGANGGLIVNSDVFTTRNRAAIIAAAARHRVPAIYPFAYFVAERRPGRLRHRRNRLVASRGVVCRSHPARREAERTAGAGADQVRACHQPQDRQGARPRRAADAARPRRRGDRMKRREFITLLGGAAALAARRARAAVRQRPGDRISLRRYRNRRCYPRFWRVSPPTSRRSDFSSSPGPIAHLMALFRRVLSEGGHIEGRSFTIEARYAEGRYERLPELAVDLARRGVALILATPNANVVRAAQAATAEIPILFSVGGDPVGLGLVASLSHPGGNATGVNFFLNEIVAKRLDLLRELVPAASRYGAMLNPNQAVAEDVAQELRAAGSLLGLQIDLVRARNSHEIEAAFATLKDNGAEALFVAPDTVFVNRRVQITTLAATHAIPAIYTVREYVEVGGLMSYGTDLTEVYRQLAIYAGRILKGAKPADLPVVQSTKFELLINLPTARALRLEVPPTLLARADEVIE